MGDDTGLLLLLLIAASILLGAGYKLGAHHERKTLTNLFVEMTEKTYYEGLSDGIKQGQKAVK